MSCLRSLKQCLQRRYGTVATGIVLIALLTFFLEHNYVGQKRDLLYWREMMLRSTHQPCLLIALIATVVCPLLTVSLIQQHLIRTVEGTLTRVRRRYHRRRFANFIVRRLLLQLELAMLRMPRKRRVDQHLNDPKARMRYEMAKEAAYRAVDVFRRDAAALLFKRYLFSAEEQTFVLHEEELMLMHGGYGQIALRVDCQLLRHLLYPQASDKDKTHTHDQALSQIQNQS